MRLAIVGSRNLDKIEIEKYVPKDVDEIVSGGAKGVDRLAKNYAIEKGIKYTEFLPEYALYRKAAPIRRNEKIASYADAILAFWNGHSKGTQKVIGQFEKLGKNAIVILVNPLVAETAQKIR